VDDSNPTAQRRKGLGLTQTQLAEAAGVTQQTISEIESGRIPRLATAYAVATALGATPEELFPQAVAS
jgi:transcriptional regulator with XRE-family HTH domain